MLGVICLFFDIQASSLWLKPEMAYARHHGFGLGPVETLRSIDEVAKFTAEHSHCDLYLYNEYELVN